MIKGSIYLQLVDGMLRATLLLALLWTNTFLHDMANPCCFRAKAATTSSSYVPVVNSDDISFADSEKHCHDAVILASKQSASLKSPAAPLIIASFFYKRIGAVHLLKQAPRPPTLLVARILPLYLINRTLLI